MNNATLAEHIRKYERAKRLVDNHKADLKDATDEMNLYESEVIAMMLQDEAESGARLKLCVDGRNYSINTRTHWSIPAAQRDDAFNALRVAGLGDLIKETVDPRTLTSTLEAAREEYGGILPQAYQEIGAVSYDETKLYARKS